MRVIKQEPQVKSRPIYLNKSKTNWDVPLLITLCWPFKHWILSLWDVPKCTIKTYSLFVCQTDRRQQEAACCKWLHNVGFLLNTHLPTSEAESLPRFTGQTENLPTFGNGTCDFQTLGHYLLCGHYFCMFCLTEFLMTIVRQCALGWIFWIHTKSFQF